MTLSSTSFAALTCTSLDKKSQAIIELAEHSFIKKVTLVKVGLKSVIFTDAAENDQVARVFSVDDIDFMVSRLLRNMRDHTILKDENYTSVTLQTILPQEAQDFNLIETTDYLQAGNKGLALLLYKNSSRRIVGATFLGWLAGPYVDCK